ncbi:cell wall-binding repeat-containing protein [Olsenella sp. Marseille-QA0557]|uniref:cell wall-binding repeat-containing protein n=1 Tax=Olsenella sp. Marseille-QA0557 TaxID=3378782 RepID=UPI003D0EF042
MRRFKSFAKSIVFVTTMLLGLTIFTAQAHADTIYDLYGTTYDRFSVIEQGEGYTPEEAEQKEQELVESAPTGEEDDIYGDSIEPYSRSSSLQPMSLSGEILYFCKWESNQNYDQGLSAGDGYHAMGFFQFDNRYGLGDFLKAVYNYNPTKYSCLKVIGTRYGWNVSGTTFSGGRFTQLGNDLNAAWHAAYKADPTEFSNLQNAWAYQEYYLPAESYLKSRGIDISNRSDSVKSLCWGMCNLFGTGGWRKFVGGVTSGYGWDGKWYSSYNWPGAGLNNSMSDSEFVTVLCDYVINNVGIFYKAQPQYHAGWQNRYRDEKAHYLDVIAKTEVDNPSQTVNRLWGQDAYGVMTAVDANYADGSCETVIVASGDGYWDALSASSLAGYYDCPVLITPTSKLRTETANEIKRLGAKKVIIVGGPLSVSDGTMKEIGNLGVQVERISGKDAAAVAVNVSNKIADGRSSTALLATSLTYQDALSAAPYAYAKQAPIFLTNNKSGLTDETVKAIKEGGYTRVIVMGGPLSIPESVITQLNSLGVEVVRMGGETAVEVSLNFADLAISEGMSANCMSFSSSNVYHDALTGAGFTGSNNSVNILVNSNKMPLVLDFVGKHKGSISTVYVYGGWMSVSHSLYNQLVSTLG